MPTLTDMSNAELGASKTARITKAKAEAMTRIYALWPSFTQANYAFGFYAGMLTPAVGLVVTGASNVTPVVVTCTAHGFKTGDKATITGVVGNLAANVSANLITVVDANNFSLNGIAGTGAYTSGGVAQRAYDLACKNDVATVRTAEVAAEAAINALGVVSSVIAFVW